jgi:hypothetical protein
MNRFATACAVACAIALAGCAHRPPPGPQVIDPSNPPFTAARPPPPPQQHWSSKFGANEDEYLKAQGRCQMRAAEVDAAGASLLGRLEMLQGCMMAEGWRGN